MYLQHFKLKSAPFAPPQDPKGFWLSAGWKELLQQVQKALGKGARAVVVTGRRGAGKTAWARVLHHRLASKTRGILVSGTVQPDTFLHRLMEAASLKPPAKASPLEALASHLKDPASEPLVAVVDDAQALDPETLRIMNSLASISVKDKPRFQAVLIGEPGLADARKAEAPQLLENAEVNAPLPPFTRAEVLEFLRNRIRKAGGKPEGMIPEGSADLIYEYSQGLPGVVCRVADKALMAACLDAQDRMSEKAVATAIAEIQGAPPPSQASSWRRLAIAGGIGVTALFVALVFFLQRQELTPQPPPPSPPAVSPKKSPALGAPHLDADGIYRVKHPGETALAASLTLARLWGVREIQTEEVSRRLKARQGFTGVARSFNLRAVPVVATAKTLARLDLPAIVQLLPQDDAVRTLRVFAQRIGEDMAWRLVPRLPESPYYALVVGLHEDRAVVLDPILGKRRVSLRSRPWSRRAILWWKDPVGLRWNRHGVPAETTVPALQSLLAKAGYPLERSGVFDDATRKTLARFQKQAGIKPTGRLNAETVILLLRKARAVSMPSLSS